MFGMELPSCIIHHESVRNYEEGLTSPQDLSSWKTLLKAAEIRNHQPILNIAANTEEGKIPEIYYHRKCRSLFTMKKSLESISKQKQFTGDQEDPDKQERRASNRQVPASTSRVYEAVCLFCNKISKYTKGENTRENLVKCVDLRADDKIRKMALMNGDERIIGLVCRDLVAAEAHYHRSCY